MTHGLVFRDPILRESPFAGFASHTPVFFGWIQVHYDWIALVLAMSAGGGW
ncbi:hypothetical protein V7S43_017299 [Phytophthora oleae]|uniref:Uncharacterized protein n=1 Tax=Phytophthora oleae TaxID=2107226 RepID=A0ABD3EVL3_9STRA